jgi:squalene synthase HpnC
MVVTIQLLARLTCYDRYYPRCLVQQGGNFMRGIDPVREGDWGVLEQLAARSSAQMGAENFPVALRVLPRRPRTQLANVYAYARFVDDVGDEAPGDRTALLDLIESDVRALPDGRSVLPVVSALRAVVQGCGMPLEPLLDLIEANRVDQTVARYETFDDLLGYCLLSAAPVGRIVLHIAGAATARNVSDSDAVCAALQVLEHCQDVGEDARAGRVYLPVADLRAANAADAELLGATTSAAVARAVAVNVARADGLLRDGRGLVRRLSGWARLAVSGYVAGGHATVTALRRNNYDVLGRDITPSRLATVGQMARLLVAPVPR